MDHGIKRRIYFFIIVLFALFAMILMAGVYFDQQKRLQREEDTYASHLGRSYEKILLRKQQFCVHRAQDQLQLKGVIEAFEAGDRTKLFELMQEQWNILRRDSVNFAVMEFHRSDGTVLLRMHAPEDYGDAVNDRVSSNLLDFSFNTFN